MNIVRLLNQVARKHDQPVSQRTDDLRCHHCGGQTPRAGAIRRHLLVRHALASAGAPTARRILIAVCPRCAQANGFAPRPQTSRPPTGE